ALIILQQPVIVGLRFVSSDTHPNRCWSALEGLNRMHYRLEIPTIHQIESFNMLIGSHFETAIKRDVYQSIRESMRHPEATMALNDGQLAALLIIAAILIPAAILILERLPAGWVIIPGPSGTGK